MALASELIDWGAAARPMPGETESGDRHVVAEVEDDVLVAVIDALGHGPPAQEAARIAADAIEANADAPLPALFQCCHKRLQRTRGVVMSAARFDRRGNLTWLGIGNVDGVLVSAPGGTNRPEWLLVRSGVLGGRLPAVQPSVIRVAHADTLYIATDGVRLAAASLSSPGPPQRIADGILHRRWTGDDDGLVLVARYIGGQTAAGAGGR